jgi:nitric oxide reductase subunit B
LRAEAFESNLAHYSEVFAKAIVRLCHPRRSGDRPERCGNLSAFFFWTSWAAATNRPERHITYTHNWPHEPLVGNRPTGEAVVWTGVSIIMLLAGISRWSGGTPRRRKRRRGPRLLPETIRWATWEATPSQRATVKYFWVVAR